MSRALVFGGTGAVGTEVVRQLARAEVETVFTYYRSEEKARELAAATSQQPVRLDLTDFDAVRALLRKAECDGRSPDILIHSAALTYKKPWTDVTDAEWESLHRVNCGCVFAALQELAPIMAKRGNGDIVLIGALDRAQSLPMPVPFAASQGTLSAMTMALAKELGPAGIRVNMIALGVLEAGLSRHLDPKMREDYLRFSALRRLGTASEAARAVLWMALDNTYMNGKVLAVTGGI